MRIQVSEARLPSPSLSVVLAASEEERARGLAAKCGPSARQASEGSDDSISGKGAEVSSRPRRSSPRTGSASGQRAQYLSASCAPPPASDTPSAPLGGTAGARRSGRAAAASASPPPAPWKGPTATGRRR